MTFRADLDLQGRRVLMCGAEPAALGTLTSLVRAGAHLTVLAYEVPTSVRDLADRGLITWLTRDFAPDDLTGAAVVVAATGRRDIDDAVCEAAAKLDRPTIRVSTAVPSVGTGCGHVTLVGGGPGDPGLLTIAGLTAIQHADVIICDRLAPLTVLDQARPGAEIIDVGKIPRGEFTSQQRINQLLIEHARRGVRVVRLKGGDSFVFGRGGEEWQACAAAGIAVDVIPGVTSAVAGPALAGIPLTHRQLTQGFTVVSAHLPPGHPGSTLDWAALARSNTTLVIMMGVATLPATTAELIIQGLPASTPAATVADAGLPSQRTVRGTLESIARLTQDHGLQPPAITVIGTVAAFAV